jgi:hypothetical protein
MNGHVQPLSPAEQYIARKLKKKLTPRLRS